MQKRNSEKSVCGWSSDWLVARSQRKARDLQEYNEWALF